MNNIQIKLIVLLFIVFAFPQLGSSQDNVADSFSYEVNKVFTPLSISKEQLVDAITVSDLNKHYKTSWVRKYNSVEVKASNKGILRKVVSEDDILSQEQKDIMNMADIGTDITVKVLYIPENTLTHNDIKDFKFSFMVNPEIEAKYSGGQDQLMQYLKENAIDKIPDSSFKGYDLAAVKFTITEEGQVIDAHVFETSKDEKIDALLLETICNMPTWSPAEYANGTKVKQEFVLTVGNMASCVIPLLNIRKPLPELK